MDKPKILEIANTIRKSSVKNKETYFADKYSEFKQKYPVLYASICSDKMEYATLEYMLDMLDSVQNKKMTQEDASVAVGQVLFDKYCNIQK